ncbi:unnamed protein product, partial [Rotaria sordida]
MDSDQENDESGLFFDEEDDSDYENKSDIELDEEEGEDVAQTNIYGEQMILANNSTSNWQEVTENAIHSFLGLLIIMSLHRLP